MDETTHNQKIIFIQIEPQNDTLDRTIQKSIQEILLNRFRLYSSHPQQT